MVYFPEFCFCFGAEQRRQREQSVVFHDACTFDAGEFLGQFDGIFEISDFVDELFGPCLLGAVDTAVG